MESTKRIIKWGLFIVIAVFVIAISSVMISFAAQDATDEVEVETSQEGSIQEVVSSEAVSEQTTSNSKIHYTFDVSSVDSIPDLVVIHGWGP